jgi:hypothetical protein
LQSPLEGSAIGVEARLERVKQTGPEWLKLWGSIDVRGLQWEQVGEVRKASVEVFTVQQDKSGALLEKRRKRVDLTASGEQYLEYLKTGLVFAESVEPKAGMTTVRLIVGDAHGGASGTLIIPAARIR